MAKRPAMDLNLDVTSLQSRLVQQPDPVQSAVEKSPKPVKHLKRTSTVQETARDDQPSSRQKGRAGKVSVQTWVSNETRRRLKVLAAQTDVSIEEYLAKAIDELLASHNA